MNRKFKRTAFIYKSMMYINVISCFYVMVLEIDLCRHRNKLHFEIY